VVALLLLVGVAPPALAFAAPMHSSARVALAWSAFYWTLPVVGIAWLTWTNYAFTATVDGDVLRVLTLRGRRALDLRRLTKMRSLSMWGQFGAAHAFRLHGDGGEHALVLMASQLTALNRRNLDRARLLRAALAPYADCADARGRSWLGAGPPPSRIATARHVATMMLLYVVVAVALLLGLAAFIATAVD
jgi:hypothetical protein